MRNYKPLHMAGLGGIGGGRGRRAKKFPPTGGRQGAAGPPVGCRRWGQFNTHRSQVPVLVVHAHVGMGAYPGRHGAPVVCVHPDLAFAAAFLGRAASQLRSGCTPAASTTAVAEIAPESADGTGTTTAVAK